MAGYSMDIDPPISSQGSNLKRSSSAPMINMSIFDGDSNGNELIPPQLFGSQPRSRRFSASFSPNSYSPQSPVMPFRINQIKHEEGMAGINREMAHERQIHSALKVSLSCEDLTLDPFISNDSKRNMMEPLHIHAPVVPICSSLSPTCSRKQCYSPSMQLSVRSPNPSPTRKIYTRRSLSPIALRPSQLPFKRKCDLDDKDTYSSPNKRFHSGAVTPERNLLSSHPLAHSLSSSSLEDSASPEQTVPMGRAVHTPESVSSTDSLCSVFKTVEQDAHMHDSTLLTPNSTSAQGPTN